ncbi:MAG: hypothetical protein BZY75_01390 [SAR202 cluster bacterium Io17-Chloro-G7]|nr:MAG: hypothetical protein BZY75_01390 [SAR202 cluster bacterium Io17-Chloro-G7]
MADTKPEYVELLNTIRLQEMGAGIYLKAWADKTSNESLKHCLTFVAEREVSHGDLMDRRIRELGYQPEGTEDPNFKERMDIMGSDMSDAEKIQCIRDVAKNQVKPTTRDKYIVAAHDPKVDPLTRTLLGWFADVEADSGAMMGETYKTIEGVS